MVNPVQARQGRSDYLSSHGFDVISRVVVAIGMLGIVINGVGMFLCAPYLYDRGFVFIRGFLMAFAVSFMVGVAGALLMQFSHNARRDASRS